MAVRTITVPIQVQMDMGNANVQISNIRAAFQNAFKADTTTFSKVTTLLNQLEQDSRKVGIAFSKGFTSQAEVGKAERSINDMNNALAKVRDLISKTTFKDLKLGEIDTQNLVNVQKEISNIERGLANIKKTQIGNLFQNTDFKAVAADLKITEKQADNLDKVSAKIEKEQSRREAAVATIQTQIAALEQLNSSSERSLQLEEQLAAIRERTVVKEGADGAQTFELERSALIELNKLLVQFGQRKTTTVESVAALERFNEFVIKNKDNLGPLNAELEKAQERFNQVANASGATATAAENIVRGTSEAEQQVAQLDTELKELETNLLSNAQNSEKLQESIDNTGVVISQAGQAASSTSVELTRLSEVQQRLDKIQSTIKHWLGFGAAVLYVRRAIQTAFREIKELDAAMTEIAVVTDMTTADLWKNVEANMAIAKQYGVTTKGVYEVQQLYYQMGLSTNEVNKATAQTLQMARISGMEYADTTDAMVVALRGFNLEMEDSQRIVDVYSKLAAISAASTEELAVAMSKVASAANAAGSTFENTTAMLTLMQETTREAPENIGTALKSIIARFGEIKKSPLELIDVDGEMASFSKVDDALASIGISLKDASNQMRDFDEIVFELADIWDTLDKNTQRYVATVMAGNRQQSRFIALVSDSERLKELSAEAADSADAALIQYSKTLDSIEVKLTQVSTSFQQFYMNILSGPVIGTAITALNSLIETLNKLPTAVAIGAVITILAGVAKISTGIIAQLKKAAIQAEHDFQRHIAIGMAKGGEEGVRHIQAQTATGGTAAGKGFVGGFSGALSTLGTVISKGLQIAGIVSILYTAIDMFAIRAEERIGQLSRKIESTNLTRAQSKQEYRDLESLATQYKKIQKEQDGSNEKRQELININQQILEQYPSLFAGYDAEGNAVADLGQAYQALAKDKELAYSDAVTKNILANISQLTDATARLYGVTGYTGYYGPSGATGGLDYLREYVGNFLDMAIDALKREEPGILGDISSIANTSMQKMNDILLDSIEKNVNLTAEEFISSFVIQMRKDLAPSMRDLTGIDISGIIDVTALGDDWENFILYLNNELPLELYSGFIGPQEIAIKRLYEAYKESSDAITNYITSQAIPQLQELGIALIDRTDLINADRISSGLIQTDLTDILLEEWDKTLKTFDNDTTLAMGDFSSRSKQLVQKNVLDLLSQYDALSDEQFDLINTLLNNLDITVEEIVAVPYDFQVGAIPEKLVKLRDVTQTTVMNILMGIDKSIMDVVNIDLLPLTNMVGKQTAEQLVGIVNKFGEIGPEFAKLFSDVMIQTGFTPEQIRQIVSTVSAGETDSIYGLSILAKQLSRMGPEYEKLSSTLLSASKGLSTTVADVSSSIEQLSEQSSTLAKLTPELIEGVDFSRMAEIVSKFAGIEFDDFIQYGEKFILKDFNLLQTTILTNTKDLIDALIKQVDTSTPEGQRMLRELEMARTQIKVEQAKIVEAAEKQMVAGKIITIEPSSLSADLADAINNSIDINTVVSLIHKLGLTTDDFIHIGEGQYQFKFRNIQKYLVNLTTEAQKLSKALTEATDPEETSRLTAELTNVERRLAAISDYSDAFNFMKAGETNETIAGVRALYDGINDYVKMMADLRKGTNKGKMALEDFNNAMDAAIMFQQQKVNELKQIGGSELIDAETRLAELSKMHLQGLANAIIAGGQVVVDTSKMAMGNVTSAIDEGTKAIARQQIAMIDKQIAALEAMKAIEEAMADSKVGTEKAIEVDGQTISIDDFNLLFAGQNFENMNDVFQWWAENEGFTPQQKAAVLQTALAGLEGMDEDFQTKLNEFVAAMSDVSITDEQASELLANFIASISEIFPDEQFLTQILATIYKTRGGIDIPFDLSTIKLIPEGMPDAEKMSELDLQEILSRTVKGTIEGTTEIVYTYAGVTYNTIDEYIAAIGKDIEGFGPEAEEQLRGALDAMPESTITPQVTIEEPSWKEPTRGGAQPVPDVGVTVTPTVSATAIEEEVSKYSEFESEVDFKVKTPNDVDTKITELETTSTEHEVTPVIDQESLDQLVADFDAKLLTQPSEMEVVPTVSESEPFTAFKEEVAAGAEYPLKPTIDIDAFDEETILAISQQLAAKPPTTPVDLVPGDNTAVTDQLVTDIENELATKEFPVDINLATASPDEIIQWVYTHSSEEIAAKIDATIDAQLDRRTDKNVKQLIDEQKLEATMYITPELTAPLPTVEAPTAPTPTPKAETKPTPVSQPTDNRAAETQKVTEAQKKLVEKQQAEQKIISETNTLLGKGPGYVKDIDGATETLNKEWSKTIQAGSDYDKKLKEAYSTGSRLAGVDLKKAQNDATAAGQTYYEKLQKIKEILDQIKNIKLPSTGGSSAPPGATKATGTVPSLGGRSYAQGSAKVKGRNEIKPTNEETLVGELGRELVVANGRYYTVGDNGAEFVKLPKDAIVFNHLQTASLLGGQTGVRGTAMAEGNVHLEGPSAATGIDAQIEALRKLRAMWESLLSISIPDLIKKAAAGGAGGGGGRGGGAKTGKEFTMQLQQWYNWLRQIETSEAKINQLIAERNNLTSGSEYVKNLRAQQKLLERQISIRKSLLESQNQELRAQRALIEEQYKKFIYFDAEGTIQLNLQSLSKIKDEEYATKIQEAIDAYQELMNTVNESKTNIEELETQIADLQQQLVDNQINLEKQLYDTYVRIAEKDIERVQKEYDMKSKASQDYLNNLRNNLQRERDLYQKQQTITDREALQRRLAILRRDTSGRSASEIASLEKQLNSMLKDEYFSNVESAIDEIQKISEEQLKAQERQIEAMQEWLQIQQEQGLIWEQVADKLSEPPEAILDFIQGNNEEFINASALSIGQAVADALMSIEIFKAAAEGGASAPTSPSSATADVPSATASTPPSKTTLEKDQVTFKLKGVKGKIREQADEKSGVVKNLTKAANITVYGPHKSGKFWRVRWGKESTGKFGYMANSNIKGAKNYKDLLKKKPQMLTYYKQGGMADFTGPAWLDGTKRKPEAVLNAEQTSLFKKFINGITQLFGRGSTATNEEAIDAGQYFTGFNSLIQLTNDTNNALSDIANNNLHMENLFDELLNTIISPDVAVGGTTPIIIENVDMTIESGVIANSYDAVRAGRTIKDEFLNIAQHTTNLSISRR